VTTFDPNGSRRVRVLPDSLINKIAAGEVVERPASVVKELVENAVDAGASRIVVAVRGGGRGLIRVRDDGSGMSRADAVAALERHATSKIRTDEDLFAISSFGFRGEAIPSIAEVSSFELRTGEPGAESGTRIAVEQGVIEAIEDAANPGGTEVTVRRLFVSTPVRLKFLKAERTEMGHVTDWMTRIALAHPEIGFRLESGDRTVLDVPATDALLPRAEALLGKATAKHLRTVEVESEGLRLEGLLSLPTLSRSSTAGLYLFVNGRFVRDRAMTGAALSAWRELLPRGRYPVAVLFLDLPPDQVDVNVHPQKLEVRFRDGRGVWRFVTGSLSRRLASLGGVLGAPETEQPALFDPPRRYQQDLRRIAAGAPGKTDGMPGSRPVRQWSPEQAAAVLDRAVPRPSLPAADRPPPRSVDTSLEPLGYLSDAVLLCRAGEDLLIVDLADVRRRLLEARLRTGTEPLRTRRLLVPGLLELSARDLRSLEAAAPKLAFLGVEIGAFGAGTIAVHALALEYDSSRAAQLLTAVRDALLAGHGERLPAVLAGFVSPGPERASDQDLRALLGDLEGLGPPAKGMAAGVVRVDRDTLRRWLDRGRP
jgi:DNA mismatch repair protein MutL